MNNKTYTAGFAPILIIVGIVAASALGYGAVKVVTERNAIDHREESESKYPTTTETSVEAEKATVSSSPPAIAKDTNETTEVASVETSGDLVANSEQSHTSHQKPIISQDPAKQDEGLRREASSLISEMHERIENKKEQMDDVKNDWEDEGIDVTEPEELLRGASESLHKAEELYDEELYKDSITESEKIDELIDEAIENLKSDLRKTPSRDIDQVNETKDAPQYDDEKCEEQKEQYVGDAEEIYLEWFEDWQDARAELGSCYEENPVPVCDPKMSELNRDWLEIQEDRLSNLAEQLDQCPENEREFDDVSDIIN